MKTMIYSLKGESSLYVPTSNSQSGDFPALAELSMNFAGELFKFLEQFCLKFTRIESVIGTSVKASALSEQTTLAVAVAKTIED